MKMKNGNMILIGMPGCGKSTAGVILAKILCCNFIDLDLLIQNRQGTSLEQLIEKHGMSGFLEIEAESAVSLNCENTVVATGGSAVLTQRGADALKRLGTVVFIDVPVEELEKRLSDLAHRGVVMEKGQTITDIARQRRPFYEKTADLTVAAGDCSTETLCRRIICALNGNN